MNQQDIIRQAAELYARERRFLTDLQKDIVDTYGKLIANPFERNDVINQIKQNNTKYPDMYATIQAIPKVTAVSFETITDSGLQSNLYLQLEYLYLKETQNQIKNQQQSWRNR